MLLRIRTRDDYVVEVEAEEIQCSYLIKMLSEGLEKDGEEIPLYNVDHCVFLKILEFTRHYQKDPMKKIEKPLINDNPICEQKWYIEFVSSQNEKGLYEILEAATYLDIEPLQELICARIASLIKGTECHELKKIFGLDYET